MRLNFINSHIDYAEKQLSKKQIHSCYLEANNTLSIYQNIKDQGVIKVYSIHQGRFIIKDVHGNTSELLFNLKSNIYKVPSNELLNAPVVATFPIKKQIFTKMKE